MKKIFAFAAAAALLCSCSTTTKTHTSSTEEIATTITSKSVANLDVKKTKITYTLTVGNDKDYKSLSEKALKSAAVAKALEANGNADVLVAPDYEVKKKNGRVQYVTVKGYPAFYTNIRPN